MRTKRPKDVAKLKAESVEPVRTFEAAILSLESDYLASNPTHANFGMLTRPPSTAAKLSQRRS